MNLAMAQAFTAGHQLVAAASQPKTGNGGFGLLVVAVLVVAFIFLFRSMNKHLRKAQKLKADDEAAHKAANVTTRVRQPGPPPSPRAPRSPR